MNRKPKPHQTCTNEILNDDDVWVPCGAPADGLHPDASPCCPRCRAAANAIGAGLALWISEQLAAMDAIESEAAADAA